MVKILNIYTKGIVSANSSSFLTPIIKNKNNIENLGVKVNFFQKFSESILDCDTLVFESKLFKHAWGKNELHKTKDFFDYVREKVKRFIFVDLSDSSSFVINEALELVDIYFKNQIYHDRELYSKNFYGRRIFSDFYHKKSFVTDNIPEKYKSVAKKDVRKIKLSWNSCFANYSYIGSWMQRIYKILPLNFFLTYPKYNRNYFYKSNDITCRMNTNYSKNTIAFQRKEIRKILSGKFTATRLSKYKYYQELKKSRIMISPFGYGEINLKDFEGFLYKCLVFKPNMDHLETWPNLYVKNKTYLDFSWNLNDIQSKLDNILSNPKQIKHISENAYNFYLDYLNSSEKQKEFSERFVSNFIG